MTRSGFFSRCHSMRNTDLISHTRHYLDVITDRKVKSSKKPKSHVPITKPKLILGQTTQKRLILKNPPKPRNLAFSPLTLLPGSLFTMWSEIQAFLFGPINVSTRTGYKIDNVKVFLPPTELGVLSLLLHRCLSW